MLRRGSWPLDHCRRGNPVEPDFGGFVAETPCFQIPFLMLFFRVGEHKSLFQSGRTLFVDGYKPNKKKFHYLHVFSGNEAGILLHLVSLSNFQTLYLYILVIALFL